MFPRNLALCATAILAAAVLALAPAPSLAAKSTVSYPGRNPGRAHAIADGDWLRLSNNVLTADWMVDDGAMRPGWMVDLATEAEYSLGETPFFVKLKNDRTIEMKNLKILGVPRIVDIQPDNSSPRAADMFGGKELLIEFVDTRYGLEITWRAQLRDGSNYVRQFVRFKATRAEIPIEEIVLLDAEIPAARLTGSVDGSPVVTAGFFMGFEHPMSTSSVEDGAAKCSLALGHPLRMGNELVVSSVAGIAPIGQLRRGFLHYIERERAHPYHTFLHYNSWYDIGYFSTYTADEAIEVVEAFGRELVEKRGVKLDSFLFDDGWDDHETLWEPHEGFPDGFAPLTEACKEIGTGPGVWFSPWGGYGDPREKRLAAGREHGYEINEEGFALSGPKYFERFREICLRMVNEYGANQFKFDGVGRASEAPEGSQFGSDFEAAIQVIKDVREAKPDIFINLTSGTWPSPFWTLYADSIWRGSWDHEFIGVGTQRQRWITFRDGMTYENVVLGGELYPLSSLMLHGVIYSKHARDLWLDPGDDLQDEIRSGFASGTQLQELYISYECMTDENWDDIAESAKWARRNAATLADTHWIGDDPRALNIYGWASWRDGDAIFALRNPSDQIQAIRLDARMIFELPEDAKKTYRLSSPYDDQRIRKVTLRAGEATTIEMMPFEVLVFD